MTAINTFIKRHPVLTYFVLTLAISWGGVLLLIGGPGNIPATPAEATALLPLAIVAILTGPTTVGLFMTRFVDGKAGLRDFLSRLLRWRVNIGWYAIALLATPLLVVAILLALSLVWPEFVPGIFVSADKLSILLAGIAVGLVAGIFEEIGWTGFAIPKLRLHYSTRATGLIVGFLWGAWHYLMGFWASGDADGNFSLPLLLPHLFFYIGVLPIYRVLMVWLYDQTESLLLAMLMHASLTGSVLFIFVPLSLPDAFYLIWYTIMAVALWIMAAVVVVNRKPGDVGRKPPESKLPPRIQAPAKLHPSG
jgi:hypothetical protein